MLIVMLGIIIVMDSGYVTALGSVKDNLDLSKIKTTELLIQMDVALVLETISQL